MGMEAPPLYGAQANARENVGASVPVAIFRFVTPRGKPSRQPRAGAGRRRPRTHAEHKVVVGLVVDLVQDVKHLDGEVGQRAEVGGDALLGLDVSRHGRYIAGGKG